MGKLFWIIRVGPKHSHYVSLQNGGRKRFDRDKMKRQCDHGGKDYRVLQAPAKQCQQPPEGGRSKE